MKLSVPFVRGAPGVILKKEGATAMFEESLRFAAYRDEISGCVRLLLLLQRERRRENLRKRFEINGLYFVRERSGGTFAIHQSRQAKVEEGKGTHVS